MIGIIIVPILENVGSALKHKLTLINKLMLKHIGHITVDSGQIMIVDPCYVLDGKTPKEDEELYQKTSDLTIRDKYGEVTFSGLAGNGVVSTTFDGDGVYPVYAKIDKNGLPEEIIIKLKI